MPRPFPRLIVGLELAFFALTLVLVIVWNADPDGDWEPALALVAVATAGLEICRRRMPSGPGDRFASPAERLRHRERLRQLLQEEIYTCRAKGLRQDVIVRDADRVDVYPDTDPGEKGISAWFRVGLIDTYERGICLGLRYGGDVPPVLSSATIWSPIPTSKEIGREEAFFRRADHRLPA